MFSPSKTVLAASNLFHYDYDYDYDHLYRASCQKIPVYTVKKCNAIEIQFKTQYREIKLYVKIRHLQILFKCVVQYISLFVVLTRISFSLSYARVVGRNNLFT